MSHVRFMGSAARSRFANVPVRLPAQSRMSNS